ncbi:MAG: glutamine--fructose-6-phosphate transaminase (isomerizing) [archaeon]
MCGIVGITSEQEFDVTERLLSALKRLEYRGYDSSGFATSGGGLEKEVGEISALLPKGKDVKAKAAIAHTRWATHGGVTKTNAHPHANAEGTIFAVHNGIIENHKAMRKRLESEGCVFKSQTDSEVVPHFFDRCLASGMDMKSAIQAFIKEAEGTFAILLVRKGDDRIYTLKRDSPLVLGVGEGIMMLGSDVYAFSHVTDKAVFFSDDEYAIIGPDSYAFFDASGEAVEKEPQVFEWAQDEETKGDFPHFMIKEVHEQPTASRRLIQSLSTLQKDKLERLASMAKEARRVVFVASGTSYHASLIGVYLLSRLGIEAHTVIASEFENFQLVDKDTLVVAVSQSGETMDVVTVLKDTKKKGCKMASVVNVPFSTIQRLCDLSIETLAGQEICVAATKTFTNQIITMLALAKTLGYDVYLDGIPDKIKATIEGQEKKVMELSTSLKDKRDIFVLGRGMSYPIAREIALKLKEISYIHAEGMMGGELKHGTIALIEEGTPVISLIPNHNADMASNTQEVAARGARTLVISNVDDMGADFVVPESDEAEFSIYACIIGHLLSYYIAKENGLPIDKPRNLAKSVTVK